VGFAGAGVADQAERLTLLDPLAACEGVNGGRVDGGVRLEVKGAQGLLPREAGCLDPSLRAPAGPVVALGHQQLGEEAAVGHLILDRPVEEAVLALAWAAAFLPAHPTATGGTPPDSLQLVLGADCIPRMPVDPGVGAQWQLTGTVLVLPSAPLG